MSSLPVSNSTIGPRAGLGWAGMLALAGVAAVFVSVLTRRQFLDPDVYHLMALARLTMEQGWVPMREVFSYTPIIHPTVHHEWGTGMLLYGVIQWLGAPGLLVVKYTLVLLIATMCLWCGRRRGSSWPTLIVMAPLGMLLILIAMSTVRSQMFSLLCLAILLLMLQLDREGRRWWIGVWLMLFAVWVNLHGAFIVGIGWMGAHWIEQIGRKRNPQWHLVLTGMAMLGLMFLNPFGWYHPVFIWRAIMLDRPRVDEWLPLWCGKGVEILLPLYAFSLLIVAYAAYRAGWRRMPNLLIVLLCAVAAILHKRHLALYGIAWIGLVPAWITLTPLGGFFGQVWQRWRWMVAGAAAAAGAASMLSLPYAPWHLHIPVSPADEREFPLVYPFGAVEYLRQTEFKGNLMPPFAAGAFISWELFPAVKVGMDGRYDAAYPEGLIEELMDMYNGLPGWHESLLRYPTDLLLVTRSRPLDRLMVEETDWKLVYRDDVFDMFARPGLVFPIVDRTGQPLVGRFP
jgi:hypothetical protein